MVETLDRVLYAVFRFNPAVAWHELRLRMRVGRAFLLLGIYALFAALAVVLPVWFAAWERSQMGSGMETADLGRIGLHVLTYVQLTLVLIALPAYAASTISSEREKETLEMLRATLLSPWDVVTGKLLSVLAFGAVLLGTTVPVAAWCLLLGGVSPGEVLRVYLLLLATAAWVSALGVLMSSHFTRSLGSIVASYGAILGTGVLTAALAYAGFVWLTISTHGGTTSMGKIAGAIVVGLSVAATALVIGLFVRWVLGRIPPLRDLARNTLVTVAIVIVLFGVLMTVAMPLVHKLGNAAPTALLLANPYAAAAATLEDSAGREVIQSATTPGTTSPAQDLPGYVWRVVIWLYVTAAAVLWLLAVYNYERRATD